jgi:hypothetical protein
VVEDACRARYSRAARYWEKDVEIDWIAQDPDDPKTLVVGEAKWRRLTAAEKKRVLSDLELRWSKTTLSRQQSECGLKYWMHPAFELGILTRMLLKHYV